MQSSNGQVGRDPAPHGAEAAGLAGRLRRLVVSGRETITARPPYMRALRLGIGVCVPLLVLVPAGRSDVGTSAALGALVAGLADLGAPYAARFRAMFAALVLAAAGFALGMASTALGPGIFAMLGIWSFAMAFSAAFGTAASRVGWVAIVTFLAGISTGEAELGLHELALVAGSAWMLFLTFVAWPIRPHIHVAHSVAALWRALGDLADTFDADPGAWQASRSRAEHAMRATETDVHVDPDRRFVRLCEAGETFLDGLVEAREICDGIPPGARCERLGAVLRDVAPAAASVARHVEAVGTCPAGRLTRLRRCITAVAAVGSDSTLLPPPAVPIETSVVRAPDSIRVLVDCLDGVSDAVSALDGDVSTSTHGVGRISLDAVVGGAEHAVGVLRGNLNWQSVVFRHALRVGLVVAVSTWLLFALEARKPFWVSLAIVSVLKVDLGSTVAPPSRRSSVP